MIEEKNWRAAPLFCNFIEGGFWFRRKEIYGRGLWNHRKVYGSVFKRIYVLKIHLGLLTKREIWQ